MLLLFDTKLAIFYLKCTAEFEEGRKKKEERSVRPCTIKLTKIGSSCRRGTGCDRVYPSRTKNLRPDYRRVFSKTRFFFFFAGRGFLIARLVPLTSSPSQHFLVVLSELQHRHKDWGPEDLGESAKTRAVNDVERILSPLSKTSMHGIKKRWGQMHGTSLGAS